MIYEKECPVCGAYFETENSNKKYCDKCADNAGRKMQKVEREISRSRRMYNPASTATYICEFCGREHSVAVSHLNKLKLAGTSKSSWDGKDHFFCCIEHLNQARHDHVTCAFCHKELKGCTYSYSHMRDYNYCSAECEEAHQDVIATEKGWKHKCLNCGKEFIRKVDKAYFCCTECSTAAKKNGWISPESKERQAQRLKNQVTIELTCAYCKKPFYNTYNNSIDAEIARKHDNYCSKECRSKHFDAVSRQKKIDQKAIVKARKSERSPDEPLCATCKISYKDCERMKSNFRLLPKGAHYSDKGVLVECPKYV